MQRILLILLLAILCFSAIFSTEESLENEEHQVNILASLLHEFKTPSNEIWPGFDLHASPSIVHFKNGHLYAFGLPFTNQWQIKQINKHAIHFSEQDAWGATQVMMHPAFVINGRTSFVFQLQHQDLSLKTFVHERFHLHQFEHFTRYEEQFAHYSSQWDEENQILIGIENWLLTQFLSDSSQRRVEYLKDFVAINAERLRNLSDPCIAWEDLQQRMEGLADYVSAKTFFAFPLLKEFIVEKTLLDMRHYKINKSYSVINDAIRTRHYFVGATIGHALDILDDKNWKVNIEKGMPLIVALDNALSLSDEEIQERQDRLKQLPIYNQISQSMRAQLNQEKDAITKISQNFEACEGLVIHMMRPNKGISGGGKNQTSMQLGHGKSISLIDSSFASSYDQKWQMRLKEIPFVMENGRGGQTFKLQRELVIEVDGVKIALQELQGPELLFSSLAWASEHCDLKADMPGCLNVINDEIYIHFH
jgi:hypothetical protein